MLNGIEIFLAGSNIGNYNTRSGFENIFRNLNTNFALCGVAFQAYEDALIDSIGFVASGYTGTAEKNLDFRLTTVNLTTGEPDTVLASTGSISYLDQRINYGALTILPFQTSYTITRGTHYAIVCAPHSGTFNQTTDFVTFQLMINNGNHWAEYPAAFFAGAGQGFVFQYYGLAGVFSTSKCYGKLYSGYDPQTITSGSSVYYGNRFTIPTNMGDYVNLRGVTLNANITSATAGEQITLKVYSASGTSATQIYTENLQQPYTARTSITSGYRHIFTFTSDVKLNSNNTYIIAAGAPSGTSYNIHYFGASDDRLKGMMSGYFFDNISGVNISTTNIITVEPRVYTINPIFGSVELEDTTQTTILSGRGGQVNANNPNKALIATTNISYAWTPDTGTGRFLFGNGTNHGATSVTSINTTVTNLGLFYFDAQYRENSGIIDLAYDKYFYFREGIFSFYNVTAQGTTSSVILAGSFRNAYLKSKQDGVSKYQLIIDRNNISYERGSRLTTSFGNLGDLTVEMSTDTDFTLTGGTSLATLNHNVGTFSFKSKQSSIAGTPGVLPRNAMYEYSITHNFIPSGISPDLTFEQLQNLNDFLATPFILQKPITVNCIALNSESQTPNCTITAGVMAFSTTTGLPVGISTTGVTGAGPITFLSAGRISNFGQWSNSIPYKIILDSPITLQANTYYAMGMQMTTYTSGAYRAKYKAFGDHLQFNAPVSSHRATGNGSTGTSVVKSRNIWSVALGYSDGLGTDWLIGDMGNSGGTASLLAGTTSTQVGFSMELNLPVDEVFITRIAVMERRNSVQNVRCRIFTDIQGNNAIATSATIKGTDTFFSNHAVWMTYHFAPAITIRTNKRYFVMFDITSGANQGTNVSYTYNNRFHDSFNNNNSFFEMYYRRETTDPVFTKINGADPVCHIFFQSTREIPAPFIT